MRICLVSLPALALHARVPGRGWGGAETKAALLGETLAARGHEVSVVVTDFTGAARSAERLTSLRVVNAYALDDGIPGLRFLPRWRAFHRALAEAGAEVYLQGCAAAATGQTAFFCRRRGRAFVFATASDSDVDPARVRLAARDRRLYAYGLRRADRVVTQHRAQADALRRGYGIDSVTIATPARIPPRTGTPGSPPAVVWIGSIRPVKRPDRFLALARRFPGVRFRMLGGASPGEGALYARLQEEARAIPNLELLGLVRDVSPPLEEAWALLNTSAVEGLPNTFLEAWARGVPTVSHVDPAGVVTAYGLGLVAPEGEEPLAGALSRLLGDRALRNRLGAAGREYVVREHAPEGVADRFEAVFEAVLRARR